MNNTLKNSLCISTTRGIAMLPTVMILGVMSLAVTLGITAVSLTESFISQGSTQSSRALFYAEAGVRDALVKIARKKNYSCNSQDCYSIDFSTNGCTLGNDCARVSVSSGAGTTLDPKIIVSKGIMKSSTRTLQVSVILDNGTGVSANQHGLITSAVWTEI